MIGRLFCKGHSDWSVIMLGTLGLVSYSVRDIGIGRYSVRDIGINRLFCKRHYDWSVIL